MEKCLLIPFLHSTSEVIAASKCPRRSKMTSNLSCMASIAHIPMTFWPPNASTNISLAEKHKCVYPSIPLMGWRNIIHWPSVFDRGKKSSILSARVGESLFFVLRSASATRRHTCPSAQRARASRDRVRLAR